MEKIAGTPSEDLIVELVTTGKVSAATVQKVTRIRFTEEFEDCGIYLDGGEADKIELGVGPVRLYLGSAAAADGKELQKARRGRRRGLALRLSQDEDPVKRKESPSLHYKLMYSRDVNPAHYYAALFRLGWGEIDAITASITGTDYDSAELRKMVIHTIEAALIVVMGLYKITDKLPLLRLLERHSVNVPKHGLGNVNASLPLEYLAINFTAATSALQRPKNELKWSKEMGKLEGEKSTLYEIKHFRDPIGQAKRDKEMEAMRIDAAMVKIPAQRRYKMIHGILRVSRETG